MLYPFDQNKQKVGIDATRLMQRGRGSLFRAKYAIYWTGQQFKIMNLLLYFMRK